MIIACLLLNFWQQKLWKSVGKYSFYDLLHDIPMGANGRRNDGSIRPAEWRRNGTKHATAAPHSRSHQPNTACRHSETYNTQWLHQRLGHISRTLHADIQKPTTLEKTFNNLHKINFYVLWKINKFCWKNLHLIVGTPQYYDTQQTIHNTTNNTQHKMHSCYIISFETFFGCFWRGGLFELDWFRDRRQLNSLLTVTEDGC